MAAVADRVKYLFSGKKARRMQADALREEGDRARDRALWGQAADAYRHYLALRSNDFGIWVQFGHALKESGDFDGAHKAYDRARRLNGGNSDLHLNIGHLHRLQGAFAQAASHYALSMATDGNADAQRELRKDEVSRHLTARDRVVMNRRQAKLLGAIAKRCHGVAPTAGLDFEVDDDATLDLLSHDPWMTFRIEGDGEAKGRVGQLVIEIEPVDGGKVEDLPAGRAYLDYGLGFSEVDTIDFRKGRSEHRVIIADPQRLQMIRWDPDDQPSRLRLKSVRYDKIPDVPALFSLIPGRAERPEFDERKLRDIAGALFNDRGRALREPVTASRLFMASDFDPGTDYLYWIARYASPDENDYARIAALTEQMPRKPTFSFVVPAYDTPEELLRECIDSMLAQTYPHFEICVADDCSPSSTVADVMADYAARFPNVKFTRRTFNGHISAASNSALALAENEFVVLVDHDDIIPDYALFVAACYINRHPTARVFYSDEDKINLDGIRSEPYFKGEFNRYLMYGHNMISHLGVYEKALLDEIGGFRCGIEGSQDYDLALRAYEKVGDAGLIHIPHVLYHWRTVPGSTSVSADQKSYAIVAAQAALNGYFERQGIALRSVQGFAPGVTGVKPVLEHDTPISIIIPTRDGIELLRPCIESIDRSARDNVEIVVIDNQSEKQETRSYLALLDQRADVRVIRYDEPFNFSSLNNFAVDRADGDIVCFLNNDTEVLAKGWLNRARGLLALDEIGAVGARLLYPDDTVQHFGLGLGMADHKVAGAPHAGFRADLPGYFGKARLIQEFSAVTAACMFMRRRDFLDLGGFDPELRVSYNDVDLCIRIRERGLKIVCDPDILLIHKESKSRGSDASGENAARLDREAALMRARWADVLDSDPYLSPNLALDRADFALAYPPRVEFPWQMREPF